MITSIWSKRSSPEGSSFFIDAFRFMVDQLGKVGCSKGLKKVKYISQKKLKHHNNWQSHLEIRELGHPRPQFLIGSPQHPEDSEQLVDLRVALCFQ